MTGTMALQRPWFDLPDFAHALEQSGLSAQVRELATSLSRDGYAIVDDVGLADFPAVAQSLRGLDYQGHKRIQDAWHWQADVRRLALAPKIMRLLEALYRRRPVPFQTLNFRVGTEQRSHSDTIHFDSLPHGFMCGVWVALEDTDSDNGPLHYFPGSHRLPHLMMHDFALPKMDQAYAGGFGRYEDAVEALLRESGLRPKELHVKAGQALIWAANLYHGGNRIKVPGRTRHSQVTHYYFSDCMYFTPALSDAVSTYWRQIVNIETEEVEPARYPGGQLRLPLATRCDWLLRSIARRLGVRKRRYRF